MQTPVVRWARERWTGRSSGGSGDLTCRQAARVLQSYIDGQADEGTARRMATHLASCPPCSHEADTFRDIKHSLARQAPMARDEHETVCRLRDYARSFIGTGRPRGGPASD